MVLINSYLKAYIVYYLEKLICQQKWINPYVKLSSRFLIFGLHIRSLQIQLVMVPPVI